MDFIDCPFCEANHPLLDDEDGHIFFCKGKEEEKKGKWYLRSKSGSITVKRMEDRTRLKW